MSKVKAKHEVELIEHSHEMQRHVDKIEQYEDRFKQLTNQLHVKNEQYLVLLKENEFMKSKMRTLEHHTALPGMKSAQLNVPASFIDKIRGKCELFTQNGKIIIEKKNRFNYVFVSLRLAGGNFNMEDEPEELYSEYFLDDLKNGGGISMAGRDSLSLDEIKRRNSMVPPHLRSSYSVQYQDQNINEESIFKVNGSIWCHRFGRQLQNDSIQKTFIFSSDGR